MRTKSSFTAVWCENEARNICSWFFYLHDNYAPLGPVHIIRSGSFYLSPAKNKTKKMRKGNRVITANNILIFFQRKKKKRKFSSILRRQQHHDDFRPYFWMRVKLCATLLGIVHHMWRGNLQVIERGLISSLWTTDLMLLLAVLAALSIPTYNILLQTSATSSSWPSFLVISSYVLSLTWLFRCLFWRLSHKILYFNTRLTRFFPILTW